MSKPSNHSGWPESLARIADAVGDAAALKLIADHGGTKVFVAKNPTSDTLVARSIGIKAARSLARHYGGMDLELPNGAMLNSKKLMIVRSAGSQRMIARATRSTERYVRMVRKGSGADDRQRSLFPTPGKPSA